MRWLSGLAAVLVLGLLTAGCTAARPEVASPTPATDADLLALIQKVDREAFARDHPGLYIDINTEPGLESISVANYDPAKAPPTRQEVVGYGHLSSESGRMAERVYSVFVVEGDRYYAAEFDARRAPLSEDGTWFLTEDRDAYVEAKLTVLASLLATAG